MKLLTIITLFVTTNLFSQDTLKICFLYGSKPKHKFRKEERKWFGGKLGGHVGLGTDTNYILNFLPYGQFHVFANDKNRHSSFTTHQLDYFWEIFGINSSEAKKAIVSIPLRFGQKLRFDSIMDSYLKDTPYDYAFFGMRCASSSYEILAQLDILPPFPEKELIRKIFYPKKLRKRLFKEAETNNWTIIREEGTRKRKWERD